MSEKYLQGRKSKAVATEATAALVARVKPLLIRAVKANLERWDAEREIEEAIGFDVDGIYEHYEDMCAGLDAPSTARKYVNDEETRWFLESILDTKGQDNE